MCCTLYRPISVTLSLYNCPFSFNSAPCFFQLLLSISQLNQWLLTILSLLHHHLLQSLLQNLACFIMVEVKISVMNLTSSKLVIFVENLLAKTKTSLCTGQLLITSIFLHLFVTPQMNIFTFFLHLIFMQVITRKDQYIYFFLYYALEILTSIFKYKIH